MKTWKLTERFKGEREVWVRAETKADALKTARGGDIHEALDEHLYDYRYSGPVVEIAEHLTRAEEMDAGFREWNSLAEPLLKKEHG